MTLTEFLALCREADVYNRSDTGDCEGCPVYWQCNEEAANALPCDIPGMLRAFGVEGWE